MTELGLFGKIPAKGDFIRHNVTNPAARAFEQWVQEAYDSLRGASGELAQHPVRVIFTPPGSADSVLAVLIPSQDQVGRRFPLAIFGLTPASDLSETFSVLPLVWSSFLDSAVRLGHQAQQLEVEHLKTGLATLALPTPADFTRGRDLANRVLASPLAEELHARLFQGQQALYAYNTFLTACEAARPEANNPSADGSKSTVLDCPIRVDVDLFYWLELSRRTFGVPAARPSYFWVEEPDPRLLLTLGPAPAPVLQFLSSRELEHQRLWPLRTDRSAAISAAARALGPTTDGLGQGVPLSGWLDAMAHRAGR